MGTFLDFLIVIFLGGLILFFVLAVALFLFGIVDWMNRGSH